MRKVTPLNSLAAVTLAGALAVFGCTTNMNPGSGEPTRSGPAVGPTSPATTPGTSGGNVPMVSSYSGPDPLTIMANHAEFQTKYLGPADPDRNTAPLNLPMTGQFVNPAVIANPQSTVNSSVSSGSNQVVIGDTGDFVAIPATTIGSTSTLGSVTTGATTGATTSSATVGATGGTTLGSTTGSLVAPSTVSAASNNVSNAPSGLAGTTVASSSIPPVNSNSTFVVSPTVSSAAVTSPTAATAGVTPNSNVAATNTNTSTATTTPTGSTTGTATGSLRAFPTGMASSSSAAVTMPPVTTSSSRVRAVSPTLSTSASLRIPATRVRAVSPTLGGNGTSRIRIARAANGRVVVSNSQP